MYIKVRVSAGSKQETCEVVSTDTLRISVRQKAERNMANMRVLEIVAAYYSVSSKKVRIISGHHSPHKIFSVDVE